MLGSQPPPHFGGSAWFEGGRRMYLHLQGPNHILAFPEISGPLASSTPLSLVSAGYCLDHGLKSLCLPKSGSCSSPPSQRQAPPTGGFEVSPTGKSLGFLGLGESSLQRRGQGAALMAFLGFLLSGRCAGCGLWSKTRLGQVVRNNGLKMLRDLGTLSI